MTEHVSADEKDPVHSLIELATNGGYRIHERVDSRLALSPHPEPGIAATTGDGSLPTNVYTGPCLMSPVDSRALKLGYDPTTFDPASGTGESLKSYDQFVENFLLGGGVPKLSQLVDHWGIRGMDGGSIVLILEDEEWTAKVESLLNEAGLDCDHERVFEDVRTAYSGPLKRVFSAYVTELLDNDVDILPVFTSDYSDEIDRLLEEATRLDLVADEYDETDHYFQRIAMYTTPFWLDFLEEEFDLAPNSLDMSDPLRFYDEFYNYEGSEKNIFRDYQIEYFRPENDDRERELLFVPPMLAPFGEGYTLESHAPHRDSITPRGLDRMLSRLADSRDDAPPNLLNSPLARSLTGFPNRANLAVQLIRTRRTESDRRPDWKDSAIKAEFGSRVPDETVQRDAGMQIRSAVQHERNQIRETRVDGSDAGLLNRLYEALKTDLRTVVGAADVDA